MEIKTLREERMLVLEWLNILTQHRDQVDGAIKTASQFLDEINASILQHHPEELAVEEKGTPIELNGEGNPDD